jgi:hypothetical protein
MKKHFFFLLLFFSTLVFSQSNISSIVKKKSIQDFIPKGWKKITECKGDLNKDKIDDVAFIIEQNDKKNFILNKQGLGTDTLNVNPRRLIVLLKKENAYTLAESNDAFIPRTNDPGNSCLMDPLVEGGIGIEKGNLVLVFNYWYSCGSWYNTNKTFTFRYRDDRFFLIGFDFYQFHRSTGEIVEESRNYLTKKQSETTGGNQFGDGKEKIKTIWSKIKISQLIKLKDLKSESIYDF